MVLWAVSGLCAATAASCFAIPKDIEFETKEEATPLPEPTPDCHIAPPNSAPPTQTFERVLNCLKFIGLDTQNDLKCTNDDIKRPPTCPPVPGSNNTDPKGYTNCDESHQEPRETAKLYQQTFEDMGLELDGDSAFLIASDTRSRGAAWVECNQSATELLINSIHEACHLVTQCRQKGGRIDEVAAAKCTDKKLALIINKPGFKTCKSLLSEGSTQEKHRANSVE